MRLIVPTAAELRASIAFGSAALRTPDRACDDDALPPTAVLQRAFAFSTAHPALATWFAPRLFWVEAAHAIVGSGGYKNAPTDPLGVEIGYGIAQRHQGCGYATTAVRLLLVDAFALSPTPLVFATVRPENLASVRVLEKCGFIREGDALDAEDSLLWRFIHPRT
jgi:RimJ/RimL family protein N-acetyltransferase